MPATNHGDVTQLLIAANRGDPAASDQLLPIVYDELRRLARSLVAEERPGQTLQATALVHEAYLRLVGTPDLSWDSRRHFFGAAALSMRRILVERYRHKHALKHGGGRKRVDLDNAAPVAASPSTDLVKLDAALDRLAAFDARKAEIVMLRYFAGLTNEEVARALSVAESTVRREWTYARAWLMRELADLRPGAAP